MRAAAVAVAKLRVGDAVAIDEVATVTAEVAGVDAEHREPLQAVPAVEVLQRWRLFAAGQAPGGPEVDQHPLTAVIDEAPGSVADEAGEGTVRRRLADRDVGATLADQAIGEQADHGQHGDEDGERAGAHRAKVREAPIRARRG
jgi:hypothetical protein